MRWSKIFLMAGAASALGTPVASLADPSIDLARKFGARESIQSISLSPDGTKLAVIVPVTGGERLAVVDLAGDAALKPILSATGDNDRLAYCRWATDDRMVCGAYFRQETEFGQVGFSRLFAVSADGKDVKVLSQEGRSRALYAMTYGGGVIDWVAGGKPGRVLMTREFVPENSTGTHISSDKKGLGVEAVDIETQKRSIVEPPRGEASEYISDGQGVVRVMGMYPTDERGYSKGVVNYNFRREGSRDWERLSQLKLEAQSESGFNPYAVDSRSNVVYGFDDAGGFKALYSMTLDGSATRKLLLSRTDVDVDGLIRIGRSRRVVGASYATERRTAEFFDPELKRLRGMLAKAIPQHPIIEFVDSSADESKLLLFAGSDTSPGMFYLFDKSSKQLNELLPLRSELADTALGEMKPITYAAADGAQIPGYLTLLAGSNGKNLPAIVMPHGGPSARDE
jgi:dipeptidyl aminopeptidase/acylaminoacyl peptidase